MLHDATLPAVNWTLAQYMQSCFVDKSYAMYTCPLLDPMRLGEYCEGCARCVTYVLLLDEQNGL